MSTTMRKSGKRLLAGLASGALVLTGAAFVAAPQAQAVVSASVYCSGGTAVTIPGGPGVPNDPTTVVGACSVPAGSPTNAGTLSPSNNVRAGATWIWMNVSGSATIAPTPGGAYNGTNVGVAWAQIDAQTIVVPANFVANDVSVFAGVTAPSNTAVTVRTSTLVGILPGTVSAGNTAADSEFPIAFYGTPATVVVSPLLAAIPPQFDDTGGVNGAANETWLSVVRALDSAGNLYPLNADDTIFPLTVELFNAPSANRDTLDVTGAPNFLAIPGFTYDPFSVGIQSNGSTAPGGVRPVGTNEYTVRLTPTLPDLRASSSYVVSNTLGGSYTLSFDKASYDRGEPATLTMCVNDLGGRIVPDGLDWTQAIYNNDDTDGVGRSAVFQFNAETVVPGEGFEVDGFTSEVATVAGCDAWTIIMPSEDIDFTVGVGTANGIFDGPDLVTAGYSPGWAAGVTGPASVTVKVGDGGGPTPPAATIMIVGDRLNKRSVFVDGSTTNLAGQTVTPYFRFPGQAPGMTMGVGTRTVDANGDFTWQRKTGKKITVDFRVGDVRSNKVIIPGR